MTERTMSAPPSPLPLCVHTAVGRSVGPLSNFFLQKRKGGKPHSLAGWLPPMLPGNCWSKSHSIGPARQLLWLRPRLDGEFKLRPSQIWIAMACTTMLTFYPLCCFPPFCIRISLEKNYASPGFMIPASPIIYRVTTERAGPRLRVTIFYQLMPILGSKVKTGKLHLQNRRKNSGASLFPPSHPLNEAEGAIDTRAPQRTPTSSRQIPLQTRTLHRATSCMPRSCLQADTRHITQRDRKEGSRTFEGQLRMLSAACLVVVASVLQGRRPTDRRPRQVCPFARSSVSQLVPPSMDNGNGPFTHMLCSCSPRDDALVNCSHLAFIEIN